MKKLVVHGDSLTEGYAIDLSYRWSEYLKKDLSIPIINSGISGDTTTGMLGRFQRDVIAHQPTHLVLMGGTNDLWFGTPNNLIISNLHAMTRQARHHQIETIIGIPTPFFIDENTSDLELNLQKRLITYNQELIQYCIEEERSYINFGTNMTQDLFIADGLHPNEAGQRVMANNASLVLQKILSS